MKSSVILALTRYPSLPHFLNVSPSVPAGPAPHTRTWAPDHCPQCLWANWSGPHSHRLANTYKCLCPKLCWVMLPIDESPDPSQGLPLHTPHLIASSPPVAHTNSSTLPPACTPPGASAWTLCPLSHQHPAGVRRKHGMRRDPCLGKQLKSFFI